AELTGMHAWGFGENYNIGLPFYRAVGGNAILSRWPLEAVANPSLAGRRPFWRTENSRALWGATAGGGRRGLLACVHNAPSGRAHTARQVQQVLDFAGDRPAILAGDFEARPADPGMLLLYDSGRFSGAFDGPPTYPAERPDRRIDYVLAPASWEL